MKQSDIKQEFQKTNGSVHPQPCAGSVATAKNLPGLTRQRRQTPGFFFWGVCV